MENGSLNLRGDGTFDFGEIAGWVYRRYGHCSPKIKRMRYGARIEAEGVEASGEIGEISLYTKTADYRAENEALRRRVMELEALMCEGARDKEIGRKVRQGGLKGARLVSVQGAKIDRPGHWHP